MVLWLGMVSGALLTARKNSAPDAATASKLGVSTAPGRP
jgi:hypothetical protein